MIVKKTSYGIEIKVADKLTLDEVHIFSEQINKMITEYKSVGKEFAILVDTTGVKMQDPEVMAVIGKNMAFAKESGLIRVSLIFSSATAKLQVSMKAKELGLKQIEKYFDITEENYFQKALAWVEKGL